MRTKAVRVVKVVPFEQMTPNQKKVAIAQDVIDQLYAKKLRVASGTGYVIPDHDGCNISSETSEGAAEELKKQCKVCAIGAMMLCKVAKYDNFDLLDVLNDEDQHISRRAVVENALGDTFNLSELKAIETAFESGGFFSREFGSSIWSGIQDSEYRLMAIMQNIIDHDGEFKPEVEYSIEEV